MINPGDRITLSSSPGIGKKAEVSGTTIGLALESFNGTATSEGKIMVFINLGYSKLDPAISDAATTFGGSTSESGTNAFSVDQQSGKVNVGFFGTVNLNGNEIINVSKILSANGNWSIDENGKLIAKEIETEKLKVESGITTKDKATGEYYCIFVESGAIKTALGACDTYVSPPAPPPPEPSPEPPPSEPDSPSPP